MITIVNYGMGNLGSIHNMFRKIGVASEIVSAPRDVAAARALVLPGVGHFDHAMRSLHESGLETALHEAVRERRVPVLGICLGMQLMTRSSEEGDRPGLGWIDAETRKFEGERYGIRVPHMGWNTVDIARASPLFDPQETAEQRFYFVHTYAVQCARQADVIATTQYGTDFVSAFGDGLLLGTQFHPEKSHKFGMRLYRRFSEWALAATSAEPVAAP